MKEYDLVLGKEENVHEEVTPENGKEIILTDPDSFKEIFAEGGDE